MDIAQIYLKLAKFSYLGRHYSHSKKKKIPIFSSFSRHTVKKSEVINGQQIQTIAIYKIAELKK